MNKTHEYCIKYAAGMLLMFMFLCTYSLTAFSAGNEEIDTALQKIITYSFGESREALTEIADFVRDSYGNSEERAWLENQFVQILKSDATYECKEFICRQIWIIGTEKSVPALKNMLIVEKTSDIARYALRENPSPEAGKALRDALEKAEGKVLIGIVNSLGERHDAESVNALIKFIFVAEQETLNEEKEEKDSEKEEITDEDIAIAAVASLGKIGGMEAGKALAKTKEEGTPAMRKASSEAFLMWADNLVRESEND